MYILPAFLYSYHIDITAFWCWLYVAIKLAIEVSNQIIIILIMLIKTHSKALCIKGTFRVKLLNQIRNYK